MYTMRLVDVVQPGGIGATAKHRIVRFKCTIQQHHTNLVHQGIKSHDHKSHGQRNMRKSMRIMQEPHRHHQHLGHDHKCEQQTGLNHHVEILHDLRDLLLLYLYLLLLRVLHVFRLLVLASFTFASFRVFWCFALRVGSIAISGRRGVGGIAYILEITPRGSGRHDQEDSFVEQTREQQQETDVNDAIQVEADPLEIRVGIHKHAQIADCQRSGSQQQYDDVQRPE
mmetsp:Transcript_23534/g.37400  ORF Transcript_23534/g.37400 Transcript_23534/m.37400 type:complete len:226 (-) Transcript_23534:433-1110(-)